MKKKLLVIIDNILFLGVLWPISLLFPVYWKQDTEWKNDGNDILSLRKTTGYYVRATWWQRNKLIGVSFR